MRRFHFSLLQEAQTLRVLKPLSFRELGRPFRLKTRYSIYQCTVATHYICFTGTQRSFQHDRTWWNLRSICLQFNYRRFWNSAHCVIRAGANSSKVMRKTVRTAFPSNYLILTYMCVSSLWQLPSRCNTLQAKIVCIFFWSKFRNGSLQQLDSFAF